MIVNALRGTLTSPLDALTTTASLPTEKNNFKNVGGAASFAHLESLFPGMIIKEARSFRLTRNEDIDVEELAARHGLSRRQMERLFHDRLKTSPAAKLRDIRVDQAHSLISETDMSMMEIAVACGFQSQAALRKAYRQRFGTVPSFKMRQQPKKT